MITIFSHAGEAHETVVETATHSTITQWYIALLLFIAGMALLAAAVWLISRKNLLTTLLVTSVVLLISGFGFAQTIPAISIVAITVGLIIAGFIAFSSLASAEK